MHVCVSLSTKISGTTGPVFTKFFVLVPCGHSSVLLWQRCNTLCTSGFTDDITFDHNGHWARIDGGYLTPGWSLLSMNAVVENVNFYFAYFLSSNFLVAVFFWSSIVV